MPIKVKIQKDGKEYFADLDKVMAWAFERYLKNKEKRSEAKLEPYKDRVKNFFNSLSTTEKEWYNELKNAYPAIDIDFALKRAKLWLLSNYKKDFKKFLMNWMSKENPTIQVEQKRQIEPRRVNRYIPPTAKDEDCADPEEIQQIFKNFSRRKKM